mgnify:CR=1 FL=1
MVVLFVAFLSLIAGVEGADVVKVFSAGFSEFCGEGEAYFEPVVVAGGYAGAADLKLCYKCFESFPCV